MTHDHRLLQTELGSSPVPTPVSRQRLPEDVLREAAQRLAFTSLISGALWLANWLVSHFLHRLPGAFQPWWETRMEAETVVTFKDREL